MQKAYVLMVAMFSCLSISLSVSASELTRKNLVERSIGFMSRIEALEKIWLSLHPGKNRLDFISFYKTEEGNSFLYNEAHLAEAEQIMLHPVSGDWEKYFYEFNLKHDFFKSKKEVRTLSLDEVVETLKKQANVSEVKASAIHFGVVPQQYRYSVLSTESGVIVKTEIHVKNWTQLSAKQQKLFNESLEYANRVWSKARPDVEFNFQRIEAPTLTSFSIKVTFDTNLTSKFNAHFGLTERAPSLSKEVVAHEVGHMLGLVDEYKMVGGVVRDWLWYRQKQKMFSEPDMDEELSVFIQNHKCNPLSIMCDNTGVVFGDPSPNDSHLKIILSRAIH